MTFGTDRQMFNVDCTCAKCNAHISQLPFQPTAGRDVYCADCNRAFRQSRTDDRGPRAPRQMFQVNLTCGDCGTQITELPFQPNGDKPVYCKNCLAAHRN